MPCCAGIWRVFAVLAERYGLFSGSPNIRPLNKPYISAPHRSCRPASGRLWLPRICFSEAFYIHFFIKWFISPSGFISAKALPWPITGHFPGHPLRTEGCRPERWCKYRPTTFPFYKKKDSKFHESCRRRSLPYKSRSKMPYTPLSPDTPSSLRVLQ